MGDRLPQQNVTKDNGILFSLYRFCSLPMSLQSCKRNKESASQTYQPHIFSSNESFSTWLYTGSNQTPGFFPVPLLFWDSSPLCNSHLHLRILSLSPLVSPSSCDLACCCMQKSAENPLCFSQK